MEQAGSRLPSTPADVLDLAWRRKWIILATFLVVGGAAAFLAYALPAVYRASTTILVVKAKVPESFVRSTVTTDIDDRLATITQQILSRTRLEKVILQFDLYTEERATRTLDAVIGQMRGAIDVNVLRGNNAFTISYEGSNPRLVRDVTNELAAFFIEENSKVREELAASTSQFLDSQLEGLRVKLVEQEREVQAFKERYMGQLPQQQEANLRALDRLQMQSQSIADRIRSGEERRILFQAQLNALPRVTEVVKRVTRPVSAVGQGSGHTAPVPADPLLIRLEEARAVLAQLRVRYTEMHPDVIRAARQVEEIEARVAARPEPAPGVSPAATPGERMVTVEEIQQVPNPIYEQVEAQLRVADREIEQLRQSQIALFAEIQAGQRKVENVPKLEQQLTELTRDYTNTQTSYQALLAKKLDAQIAEDLERRQKGEQFRILDAAVLPGAPYKPNRLQILGMGLAAALGLGFAAALGLDLVKDPIRGADRLKAAVPRVPLIGVVPIIPDRVAARRRRVLRVAAAGVFVGLYLAAAWAAVEHRDRIVRHPILAAVIR